MQPKLYMGESNLTRITSNQNLPSEVKTGAVATTDGPKAVDQFTTDGVPKPPVKTVPSDIPAALSLEAVVQTKTQQTQAHMRPPSPKVTAAGQGDSASQHALHAAHLAHEVHLAAEGIEGAGHLIGHSGKYVKQVKAAQDFLSAHHKNDRNLKKMTRGIGKLENTVKNGAGAEAAERLSQAKKAHETGMRAHAADKPAAKAAHDLLQAHAETKGSKKHSKTMKIGEHVVKLEKALQGSAMGTRLMAAGKVVSHPSVAKGLMLVGAGVETYAGVVDSNAQTTGGKALNGALAGGSGALVMANPLVAIGDLALPKGYRLSEVFRGSAGAITGIAEAAVTGDTRAMEKFHARSKKGDYGVVIQAASEAGDYWNDNGISGGSSKIWESLKWQFSK